MAKQTPENDYSDWIGRTLGGRFRVIELLGEGGMGAVFVAEHLTLHKEVALKIVLPEHAGNEDLAARFAREAMVTSRIEHPNVISALDYGVLEDGSAYLAMQLVRGPSLKNILDSEGSIHWSRAADIGSQIAAAVAAAKAEGIVHRDLKPENILIKREEGGRELVKVLDFGIAKFSRESLAPPSLQGKAVTQVGMVIGTPGYMAPEQAIGQRADYRADLYALGVILWECIVGKALWDGKDLQELVKNQLKGNPQTLREATTDLTIPEPLEILVKQLLATNLEDRPEDVGHVRELLSEIATVGRTNRPRYMTPKLPHVRKEPSGEQVTVIEPASAASAGATPMTGDAPAATLPSKRSSGVWLGVLAVIAVATGLVAFGQLEVKPKGQIAKVAAKLPPELGLKVEKAAPPPAPEPEPEVGPEIGATGLPLAIEGELGTLIQAERRGTRVTAAEHLLSHVPMQEVPSYVRAIAHLQLAETCIDKKVHLEKISGLADTRALPALVMISQRGKSGCGPTGRRDCLACMRADLDQLIVTFEEASAKVQALEAVAP